MAGSSPIIALFSMVIVINASKLLTIPALPLSSSIHFGHKYLGLKLRLTWILKDKISQELQQNFPKVQFRAVWHASQMSSEDGLEAMLADGWKVVTCLPSGKIVITNE